MSGKRSLRFSFRVAKEVRTEASTIMNYIRCFRARRIPAVLQDVGKMSCRVLCPVLVSFETSFQTDLNSGKRQWADQRSSELPLPRDIKSLIYLVLTRMKG